MDEAFSGPVSASKATRAVMSGMAREVRCRSTAACRAIGTAVWCRWGCSPPTPRVRLRSAHSWNTSPTLVRPRSLYWMELDGQLDVDAAFLNWMELDGEMGAAINTSTLEVTTEILSLISEIDEFKGAWRALGRIAPERLTNLKRIATIESIGSSTRIEGAKLTDREVEKLFYEHRDQVLCDQRRAGSCRLRRRHGNGLLELGSDRSHRKPHQTAPS